MKVRVQSEYYLSDDDIMMIEVNKRTWWIMRLGKPIGEGRDDVTFINLREQSLSTEDLLANKRLDVVLELEPGRYLAGCGDKNVMGDRGFPARQLLYFLVFPNGVVDYRKYDEMPSFEEFQQMLIDDPSLSEPAKIVDSGVMSGEATLERFPEWNSVWCDLNSTFKDDIDSCEFFTMKFMGGTEFCDNCKSGFILYRDTRDDMEI